MDSIKTIKRRIKAIKNIYRTTKAMEIVAALKMRKTQSATLKLRPYAKKSLEILEGILERTPEEIKKNYLFFCNRKEETLYLIIISSDKGLCGSLNSNLFKKALKTIKSNKNKKIRIIVVGKKAELFFKKTGVKIIASFLKLGDTIELKETLSISKIILNDFKEKKYDKLIIFYNNFISTLKQEPKERILLPITKENFKKTVEEIEDSSMDSSENEKEKLGKIEYRFEPSAERILEEFLPYLIKTQIYHCILESKASEHSARMIAMKNANESAKEMLENLHFFYNYARQQKITREVIEIASASLALR